MTGMRKLLLTSTLIVMVSVFQLGCPADTTDEFVNLVGGGSQIAGACCMDDGCASFTQASCAEFSGTFFPDGTCGSFSPCRGACCRDSECFIAGTKNECETMGGVFQGASTTCDDPKACSDQPPDTGVDPNQLGICCLDDSCVGIPIQECTGTLHLGASSCSDVDCTMGACCDTLTESCSETSKQDCVDSAFGEYAGPGTKCSDIDCGLGACCTSDGSACTDVTPEQCQTGGGAFMGFGTNCDRNQCLVQPCCQNDGTCTVVVPQSCRDGGGAVLPQTKDCSDSPCTVGLCCSLFPSNEPFGSCRDDFTQNGCEAQAGTFAGLGLSCSDNTFEDTTSFSITDVSNTPSTGRFSQTNFTLNVSWSGNPSFPIRVQGYIDVAGCPADTTCPSVTQRVDFRIDQPQGNTITVADWNACPGFTTVSSYAEPWRFRMVDKHCVSSDDVPLLLTCSP